MRVNAQTSDIASARAQASRDPLRPTAPDGWSPDKIVAVASKHRGGFLGTALNSVSASTFEHPGQRLSVAQVDELAPFFATKFGLDEEYVREELAKVYLYTGGPSVPGKAMTVGHHIFMPTEESLQAILTPNGKRWLTHELAHTMQFLAYNEASPHSFLADYITSMVISRNPTTPGTEKGPPVWGALFTGIRATGHNEKAIGQPASSFRENLTSTLLPATLVSIPLSLTFSGALAAARATTGRALFGSASPLLAMLGTIAAPAISGAALGSLDERLGEKSLIASATLGGGITAATLWFGGALAPKQSQAFTHIGQKLGRGTSFAAVAAAVISGAAIGLASANLSKNTASGWSSNSQILRALAFPQDKSKPPQKLTYAQAVHDSHWQEIDAEALAREFVRGSWTTPSPKSEPVQGRTPQNPARAAKSLDRDRSARLTWGVAIPLTLGIPAAIAAGAGTLGARTGAVMLKTTLKDGQGVKRAASSALKLLGSKQRGVLNSLGVGASLTIAPLMVGGIVGPLVYSSTGSKDTARGVGAATAAIVSGSLLAMLSNRQASVAARGPLGLAGVAAAGLVGLASAKVAVDALRPSEQIYDISGEPSQ